MKQSRATRLGHASHTHQVRRLYGVHRLKKNRDTGTVRKPFGDKDATYQLLFLLLPASFRIARPLLHRSLLVPTP